jgi:hypothetical protein
MPDTQVLHWLRVSSAEEALLQGTDARRVLPMVRAAYLRANACVSGNPTARFLGAEMPDTYAKRSVGTGRAVERFPDCSNTQPL